MFDMIDVIQMSKISKHYLLEYQTLLDSYEMQAPNVTSGFRVLDFSDDISDVDCTSDDWSFNESYSETSGEMTNSMQAKLLSNPPEYSVCAGSKPLSIIIRRCNTPTVVCSSPIHKTNESNCAPGNSLLPVHCDVSDLYVCPEQENTFESGMLNKTTNLSVCEIADHVNVCNKENELQKSTPEIQNRSSVSQLIPNTEQGVSNISKTTACSESNVECDLENQGEKSSFLKEEEQSTVGLLPHAREEFSENLDTPAPAIKEKKENILESTVESVVENLCLPVNGKELDYSEHIPCSVIRNDSLTDSKNVVDVPKQQYSLEELNDILLSCNSTSITNADKKEVNCVRSVDDEFHCLTSSFNGKCSNLVNVSSDIIEHCVETQNTVCATEDSHLPPLEDISGWHNLNCSPLLFSSDDESSSFTEEVNRGIEAALAPSPKIDHLIENEKRRVSKVQELLMGAPPPPAVTMPLFSASEMLQTLKDSAPWSTMDIAVCSDSTRPWIQEAQAIAWPEVKKLEYHDIHYNHGTMSEQFENLCQKLLTRCVGCETASSVTVWSSFTLPAPRRERRLLPSRRGPGAPTGLSPGRRLSHLARRHRTFSSAALLTDGVRLHNALPHAVPERRTILVEGKKKETRKPRSSKKKSAQKKQQQRQQEEERAREHEVKLNSSKRALFQSPNDEKKSGAAASLSKFRPASASAVRSRRALFAAATASEPSTSTSTSAPAPAPVSASASAAGRKRLREDSDDDMCQRLPRRKLFGNAPAGAAADVAAAAAAAASEVKLPSRKQPSISAVHKKKLLWAVAEALKTRGIGLKHPRFRVCASILAAKCRSQVVQMLTEREGNERGTSDRLLELTVCFVDEALSQHEALMKAKHNASS